MVKGTPPCGSNLDNDEGHFLKLCLLGRFRAVRSLQLISLNGSSRGVCQRLEPLGFAIVASAQPGPAGTVLIEAEAGSEIAKSLLAWELDPSRVVAICLDPQGLPPGCLWLSPNLLESAKGHNLLRAWLTESREDPVQGLLAQISHDMRSPLSVISTAASLIAKFADDRAKTTRYVALINESSGVLKSLVNDILDYSNIREGEFVFTTSDFQLQHLLQSITEGFRLLVKNPDRLRVEWSAAADLPEFVHGDPGRLRQVLTNLMNNALKFTESGHVRLVASTRNGQLHFAVEDTGVGIRPEALERIFLPYQQADSSIHSTFGGTGLGLTICRALAERMGGTIGVSSEFGKGSTFWFTANLPTVMPEQPMALPELRGRKIFVASANPSLFTTSLSAHNSLAVHKTVEEVEQNLAVGGFDLYILDLDLGQFELAGRLAKSVKDSVIVVITSAGQRGDVAMCKELGVSGYLTTPIEPQELEVALALAIDTNSNDIVTKYTAKELLAAQR
jgi:signal transduction histidine kinase